MKSLVRLLKLKTYVDSVKRKKTSHSWEKTFAKDIAEKKTYHSKYTKNS